jgi:hypothetical protein
MNAYVIKVAVFMPTQGGFPNMEESLGPRPPQGVHSSLRRVCPLL